jgi:SAM-dependent methyltransferase
MKKAIDYTRIAELYDTYVDTTFDVPFFLEESRKTKGKVLELMCGTGRISIPLLESGIDLTCLDNSPEMLQILMNKLKERGLNAAVHKMDVCEMSLNNRYQLIFIPFHSFAEILSPPDQKKALLSIHRHLSDTGRFICTLHNPQIRLAQVDGNIRLIKKCPMSKSKGVLFLKLSETYDPLTHKVTGKEIFEIYDPNGIIQSKIELNIQFCIHDKNEFEKLAESAGFKVIDLYGDYDHSEFSEFTSRFMIWILEKK